MDEGVARCELRVTRSALRVTRSALRVASYVLRVAWCELRAPGFELRVTRCLVNNRQSEITILCPLSSVIWTLTPET